MSGTGAAKLVQILKEKGLIELPEPVTLASGALSRHFIDGKKALCAGSDLRIAAEAIVEEVTAAKIEFDAVGGLTLGADALAAAVALVSESDWFIVRKESKDRGTRRLIEGAPITHGCRVLLIDDVVTTGGSILQAFDAVQETGAQVVAAVTLADRGDRAIQEFADREVPYFPMATYEQMGIPAVHFGSSVAAAAD